MVLGGEPNPDNNFWPSGRSSPVGETCSDSNDAAAERSWAEYSSEPAAAGNPAALPVPLSCVRTRRQR